MKFNPIYFIVFVVVFSLLIYIFSYSNVSNIFGLQNNQSLESNTNFSKINVIVTIAPQEEFVKAVGGDKVNIITMVPPGASPHSYEPTPKQLIGLSNAKAYFIVGSTIEFEQSWLDKLTSLNKNIKIIDCSNGIRFLKTNGSISIEKEGSNPHIWLSPKNAKKIIDNIYLGLIEVNLENKEYYLKNKNKYIKELNELNKEIILDFENKTNRKFIVYHPAWTYFANDYNLTQISIEEGEKGATFKTVESTISIANENNISVVFISPQFSKKSSEVIANEIGGVVLEVDPLSPNYIENLRNISKIMSNYMN